MKRRKKYLTNRKMMEKILLLFAQNREKKIFINVSFLFFSISFFFFYFPFFSLNWLSVIYFLFFLDIHQSFTLLKQSRKLTSPVFLFPIIICFFISTKKEYIYSKAKCQLIEYLILLHQ
jgi:hypothetical protein